MSATEYHKGRMRRFLRIQDESDVEYCHRWATHEKLPWDEDIAAECKDDGLTNLFCELALKGIGRSSKVGCVVGETIWEFLEHEQSDFPEAANIATLDINGDVVFSVGFYNGGTCLGEVLENVIPAEGVVPPKNHCSTCRWYTKGPSDGMGWCRRHAPVVGIHPDGDAVTRYPSVYANDFCGDHEK